MAGVLVVAAGIPRATGEDHDFWVLVAGYVIMRVAMIPLWLRVAREHADCRQTALRYAGGIAVIQVLWVLRTALSPDVSFGWVLFAALVVLEMALPTGPRAPARPRGTGSTSQSATSCSRSSCSAR